MKKIFLALWILISGILQAQGQTKIISAQRLDKAPKIDGKIDDLWETVPSVTGFTEYDPGFGEPAPKGYETEVKLAYDDTGIYILAVLKDPHPEKIVRVFSLRDQYSISDMFGILINPFKAPGNNYIFSVFASGTQFDAVQGDFTDFSWNAVWNSAVEITGTGWVVEMAIPYSALRFPKKKEQVWAVNFFRDITSLRKKLSWVPIDKTKQADVVVFTGELRGLKNIRPPVRLSFYPYFSVNFSKYEDQKKVNPAFGMDLKYGINENFTLDATLIPDFSDVPYDDIVLNLGPFEQFYSENRPFFTEGTQLFRKGRIFYSRRIGGQPVDYYVVSQKLKANEIMLKNPEKSKLINATKITGRTPNGLGIGLLNAVTSRTEAIVRDTLNGTERKILTGPYTNYNVVVLDYNFKDNNTVGLMNTNTLRAGHFRDANVTSLFYDIYLAGNTLEISGKTNLSHVMDTTGNKTGFFGQLEVSKQIKEHTFGMEFLLKDRQYDISDLGYMRTSNIVIYDFFYRYSILKPLKHFNRLTYSMSVGLDHIFKPYGIYRKDFSFNIFATTKKQLSLGGGFRLISDSKDYYEPRVPGRFYLDPAKITGHTFISTDYRKKFALDLGTGGHYYLTSCGNGYFVRISPRLRLSDQFKFRYSFFFNEVFRDKGFVGFSGKEIIFGMRDKKTFSQELSADYYFTVKSALSLSFRHYWAPVHYTRFFTLNEDGTLTGYPGWNRNENINFNVWNFDLGYTWEFAPGSQLTLLYRNSLQDFNRLYDLNYTENLDNLFMQPQRHNLIVKAIYYLDYNTVIRKWF